MEMLSVLCTARLYPQETTLVNISVRGWVDPRAIVRSEGFYVNEKSTDTRWYEPATLRWVVQHLSHCATAVPRGHSMSVEIAYYYCVYVVQTQSLSFVIHVGWCVYIVNSFFSPPVSVCLSLCLVFCTPHVKFEIYPVSYTYLAESYMLNRSVVSSASVVRGNTQHVRLQVGYFCPV